MLTGRNPAEEEYCVETQLDLVLNEVPAWFGQATRTPRSLLRRSLHTQPSSATADIWLGTQGGEHLYPMREASSACRGTGRSIGNGGGKNIIDNNQ